MSGLDDAEAARAPWLTLVGVGADGEAGLSVRARRAISEAELVMGSARQLALVSRLIGGEMSPWPSPFADGVASLLARRGRPTCVLASGDPFFFGIGASLADELAPGEISCLPAPSSLSLAAAKLGWALQATDVVSLHGRDLHGIIPYLQPGRRSLCLSWNRETPSRLAAVLTGRGFGRSRLHVLEALGGPEERVRSTLAQEYALGDVSDLNLVGIEAHADPQALYVPSRASLPDAAFEHDGQLTKEDLRAIALSALRPRAGARLWDVGAGSGSIGIEFALSHPACRAIAVERDPGRCDRIRRNARALGAAEVSVVQGSAPEALSGLPRPDAVFIGGGSSDPALIEACWQALPSGGRLVVHAVSLAAEACLLRAFSERGGELRRVAIDSAAPLGGMTCWRPALPVVQWRIMKP